MYMIEVRICNNVGDHAWLGWVPTDGTPWKWHTFGEADEYRRIHLPNCHHNPPSRVARVEA